MNTFYPVAAELRMSHQIIKKNGTSTYELLLLLQRQNILGYSIINHKFKRLAPHFQLSATRSALKEGAEIAATLLHSRECTKEPISALPNFGSKENFTARAELRDVLQKKLRGRGGSSCRFNRTFGILLSLWAMRRRCGWSFATEELLNHCIVCFDNHCICRYIPTEGHVFDCSSGQVTGAVFLFRRFFSGGVRYRAPQVKSLRKLQVV